MHSMDLLLSLISFLLVAGVGSRQHASLAAAAATTSETATATAYWQAMLPGVPMPPAISDLLVLQKGSNNLKSVKGLRKIGPSNGRVSSETDREGLKKISASYGSGGDEDLKKGIIVNMSQLPKYLENLSIQSQPEENSQEVLASYESEGNEDVKKITVSYGHSASYGSEGNEHVKKITVSYGEDGKEAPNKITELHGAHGQENVKEVTMSHGVEAQTGVKKVTMSYGAKVQENIKEVTMSYGPEAQEDIKKITLPYGAKAQEDIKKVTMLYGDKAQDDIKKITVSYGAEAQEDIKKVTMSYGDEAQEDIKKITMSYGAEAQEDVKKVIMSYGDEAQENIKKITVSYGVEAQEDVKKVTMSYGDEAQEDIKKITVSYGAEAQEDAKKVTMSYGNEAQEDIKKITVSYGAEAQEDVKKVTMSYGDEAQEDIKKITVSYGDEAQENVKKVTVPCGSEHDDNPKKESTGHGSHDEGEGRRYHAYTKQRLADVFFFHDMLRPGSKITPNILPTTSLPALLPRHVAEAIPFSVDRLPDILAMFAPATSAATAREIRWALDTCEQGRRPHLPGERSGCATSLESLADLAASLMGTRDVRAFSANSLPVDAAGTPALRGRHTVTAVRRLHAAGSSEEDVVTCHDLTYPYAVFYCHTSSPTAAYAVTLQQASDAEDGAAAASPATMDALAVCHLDTSQWPPEHPFFVEHGLRPGEVAVCHFLSKLSIVWVRAGGDQRGDASA